MTWTIQALGPRETRFAALPLASFVVNSELHDGPGRSTSAGSKWISGAVPSSLPRKTPRPRPHAPSCSPRPSWASYGRSPGDRRSLSAPESGRGKALAGHPEGLPKSARGRAARGALVRTRDLAEPRQRRTDAGSVGRVLDTVAEEAPEKRQSPAEWLSAGLRVFGVAGAGFEPATFGL